MSNTENKGRINKSTVDGLTCPATGQVWFWDDKLSGFFVRMYASKRKVYAVKYRLGTVQRVYTIGTHGSPWTPEQARAKATEVLKDVANNIDPAAVKVAERHALTVADLIDKYLEEGPKTKLNKRAISWETDASNLRRHILPLVGKEAVNKLTHGQAANAIHKIVTRTETVVEKSDKKRGVAVIRGGAGIARRVYAVASAMFTWGIKHGYAVKNPFHGITLTTAPKQERFLSQAEAVAFLDALATLEREKTVEQVYGDALRLLMLTGARKSEITGLKWTEIDFDRRCLFLPPERTKAGGKTGERRVTLMPAALEILTRRREASANLKDADGKTMDSPFVFPSPRTLATTGGAIVGVRRVFIRVCEKAGISNIRLHDMRHSFASFAIADGASLFLVSKLLGHASTRTTERYAHLAADPLEEAVANIGKRLGANTAIPQRVMRGAVK